MNAPPRFSNAATLRSSPASTNVAEDVSASSRSSLMTTKSAIASLMFGPSAQSNQYSVAPDLGKYLKKTLSEHLSEIMCSEYVSQIVSK